MNFFVLLYTGPTIILVAWFLYRHRTNSHFILLKIWLVVMLITAIAGVITLDVDDVFGRMRGAYFLVVGVSSIGPFLAWSSWRSWHAIWSILATAVLPFATMTMVVAFIDYAGRIMPRQF